MVAIPLGVLAAYRSGTRTDRVINTSSFALLAIPTFVLALVLAARSRSRSHSRSGFVHGRDQRGQQ